MTKSRKVRRNILKKKVNRSTRSGGDPPMKGDKGDNIVSEAAVKPDESTSLTNNPLLSNAASGVSSLTSGASDSISTVIQQISSYSGACSNPISLGTFKAFQATGVKPLLMMLEIPPSIDESIKLLETGATLKDLLGDILSNIKCTDINTISEILRKILIIDEIGKLLDKINEPEFSTFDDNAKQVAIKGFTLYENLNTIINDPKNQDLLCRMLNKMESNKHIKPEHKMAFIKLFGGSEEICKGMLSKFGETMSSGLSSLFGSKSGDKSGPILDERCGPGKEVEKPLLWGKDRCVLSDLPKPPAPAGKEGETAPVGDGTTTPPSPPAEEGTEGTQPPASTEGTQPPAGTEGTQPPAGTDGTPPVGTEETGEATFTQIPPKQKSSWWGGKYKRVKHTKKSKKSKSKKSKRSKK